MIDNINTILQNKGFNPNKIMSNKEFTAYNIDMFGKETILENLIINNNKNTWYDKTYKQGGNVQSLIMKLGYVSTYYAAVDYLKRFTPLIKPWISSVDEKPIEDSKMVSYQDELINHIYKLQTFAIMMKYFFDDMNLGFGVHYIEKFNFDEFINDKAFNDYFNSEMNIEQISIKNDINKFMKLRNRLKNFKFNNEKFKSKIVKRKKKSKKELKRLSNEEWNKTLHKMIINSNGNKELITKLNNMKRN